MAPNLSIMTWNLRHGGGPTRLPEIMLTLLDLAPDIMLLTEFRQSRGGQLAAVLRDQGWSHQINTAEQTRGNGLLLASRHALTESPDCCPPNAAVGSRWLACQIPEAGLTFAGLHIPCRGDTTARTLLWKHAVAIARAHRDGPFLLMGDLNTGRNGIDAPKRTFDCTQRLGELAAMRFTDAWRRLHPSQREGTWSGPQQQEHRIDQAHLSETLAPRLLSARHDRVVIERGLSDHACLMIELAR